MGKIQILYIEILHRWGCILKTPVNSAMPEPSTVKIRFVFFQVSDFFQNTMFDIESMTDFRVGRCYQRGDVRGL